ncbi:phenylacetate--CoA ligase family protein [Phosphitispora sp. TUW77]|uniref:phenylacetate--CoA ligase family protein n=1 Tax=Phosphitispora sp. TUW77 TaxID=3152361 RepID=UPI003AB51837
MLHKGIYKIGVKLRSPELNAAYDFLKQSEGWSLKKLEEYQFNSLKRIINIAYGQSEFYKELFDKAGITPEDIRDLNDIVKIPCITKVDILKNIESIQNIDGYRRLFLSETSGSTGEPLTFYRNSEWDARHRAAQLRGYSWYGLNPWDRSGYFWGYSFSISRTIKTKLLDFLLNRFRLFSYSESEIKRFAGKLKRAKYLEGYSSMIYEVAKTVNMNRLGPFNLIMVKGTSEKIYDVYQEETKKAFGKKIVSEYGSAETGIVAFECTQGNMHVVMENVIVEEVEGEAIITNLVSDSFPIIRYKLGDSIALDNESICSCGMKHKIIKDVIGRIGEIIYGKNSKYPSLTIYYIFKNLALKYGTIIYYQAIQKQKGKLEILLDRHIPDFTEKHLKEECKKYFSDDMVVEIYQNSLKRTFDKKYKDFISEIDV